MRAPACPTSERQHFTSPTRCGLRVIGSVKRWRASWPTRSERRSSGTALKPIVLLSRAALMITICCAGFPVPATRYFKEFLFVEVQETHVAQPGTGTIRRWRREAPAGFGFALLAPREIGQEGFREGKVTETALKNLTDVSKELAGQTAVFVAPADFTASRANKSA